MIGFIGTSLQLQSIITAHNQSWTAETLSSFCYSFYDWLQTSQSQSHITTDGQSVSKSWCRAPSGAHDQIFIIVWQLRFFCAAPSLTRGRLCLLYMLLAFASAVFFGSGSLDTRDHILLPQKNTLRTPYPSNSSILIETTVLLLLPEYSFPRECV
jgi:hypothetical protein